MTLDDKYFISHNVRGSKIYKTHFVWEKMHDSSRTNIIIATLFLCMTEFFPFLVIVTHVVAFDM